MISELINQVFSSPVLCFEAGLFLGMGIGGLVAFIILKDDTFPPPFSL